MKYLFLSIFSILLFVSCKKEAIVNSVNNTGSKDSLSYQPSVPGSFWRYTKTTTVSAPIEYNFVSLNYDSTVNGVVYHVFSDEQNGNQYIKQDGGKYYTIFTPGTNKPQLLVLDTSKSINQSWIGGVNGDETFTYTIKQKTAVFNLDAFTFKNVYKVYTEKTKTLTGVVMTSGDLYYAQGIGLIKSDLVLFNGGLQLSVNIKIKDVLVK
jgi:hypothetical protein